MPCFAKAQILWDIVSYNIEKTWHDGMTNMVFNFSWHRIVSFSDNYIISKRNWKRVAWKKISKGALLKFLEILEQMQDLSYSSACPLVNMLRAATRYVEQTSREREQAIDMHRTHVILAPWSCQFSNKKGRPQHRWWLVKVNQASKSA